MGLLSSISDVLTGERSPGSDEETFEYRCATCGDDFELPKTRMIGVRCPSCRSMDVRVGEDE